MKQFLNFVNSTCGVRARGEEDHAGRPGVPALED